MKVLFIEASHAKSYFHTMGEVTYVALGIAYLASSLKNNNIQCEFLDLFWSDDPLKMVKDYLEENVNNIDIICISGHSDSFVFQRNISTLIKQISKNLIIISGGGFASSLPSYLLTKTDVDIAIIGEGECSLVEVIDTIRQEGKLNDISGIAYKSKGEVIITKTREVIVDINNIKFPDYDIFDMEKYFNGKRGLSIITTRGCAYHCNFCYKSFPGLRLRDSSNVIDEIEFMYQKYNISFLKILDDNFLIDSSRAKVICNYLKNKNIKWSCTARANNADYEILKTIKDSGCVNITFGLESADERILKRMNKKLDLDHFKYVNSLCKKFNLSTSVNIIFGYIDEDKMSFENTLSFVNKLYLSYPPIIQWFTPFIGTNDYEYLFQKGHIELDKHIIRLCRGREYHYNFTKLNNKELVEYYKKYIEMQHQFIKEKINIISSC